MNRIDPRALGQISIIQGMVTQLPSEKTKILDFVCHGLKDTPGVKNVFFNNDDNFYKIDNYKTNNYQKINLKSTDSEYGDLIFDLTDSELFAPYIPFINNLCNTIVVVLDEKKLRDLNDEILHNLEHIVQVRTRKLEESEKKYKSLFTKQHSAVLIINPKNKEIIDVNPAATNLYGYKKNELIGMSCDKLNFDQEIISGNDNQSENEPKIYNHKRKDGSIFIADIKSYNIYLSDKIVIYVVCRDITKETEAIDALKISEAKFRNYISSAPDGIFVVDKNGNYIEINDAACEQTGYSKSELLNLNFTELIAPDHKKKGFDHFQQVLKTGKASGEMAYITKQGEKSYWLVEAVKISENRFLGFTKDISVIKNTEAALEKRIVALTKPITTDQNIIFEELFNIKEIQELQDSFANATGIASVITDTNGTPITEPSNFTRLCKDYYPEAMWGNTTCTKLTENILNPNSKKPKISPCCECGLLKAGTSISVNGNHLATWIIGQVRTEEIGDDELIRRSKKINVDESEYLTAFYDVPKMSKDQFEKIADSLFVLTNQLSTIAYQNIQQARFIFERKKAVNNLITEKNRVVNILEGTNAGTWEWNINDNQYTINERWAEIIGYSLKEIEEEVALNWKKFILEEDLEKVEHNLQKVLNGVSTFYDVEFRQKNKLNDIVWINSKGKITEWKNNTPVKMSGTHIDITDRKNMEKSIKIKNKELEDYLYIASHDMRSPLVNILGFSQLLSEKIELLDKKLVDIDLDTDQKNDVYDIINKDIPNSFDFIFKNVKKMDILLKGLSQVSRTGRLKMNISRINTQKVITEVIDSFNFEINQINANIIVKDIHDCFGDKNLLNQVFSNLIKNSIKYKHPERNLEIVIDSKTKLNKVIYTISDNGIGISDKNLEKIWNVFYRVDPKNSDAGEGIGLSIVKKIVAKHRGNATVNSVVNQGTSFYIELPKNSFTEEI